MIRALSEVLRRILEDSHQWSTEFPAAYPPSELMEAHFSFVRPSETFTPGQTTVNLFLYAVHENVELRSNEPTIARQNGQVVIRRPALRVNCSYLITAWAGSDAGDEAALIEQRLLSQVLQVLSGYSTIPATLLRDTPLEGQVPPLPLISAQLEGMQNPAEFWTALGNKLRPSITVMATISVPPVFSQITAPMVTTRSTRFGTDMAAEIETLVQIGGRVMDAADHGIENAVVDLVDAGLRTHTNSEGYYSFLRVPPGSHTLRIVAVGFESKTETIDIPGRSQLYQTTLSKQNSN
ncbi:Pvc16 family protein [Leptolyngbya sp. 7M]|uniref:Pvc16 family protein n=1 Tax=Leptolyngbya sp. 7M TaxID=2812896 RepID=UPI001B8C8A09|nr:Pvc16 family protein [Leptolyngbya sp. 7M]QYO63139.1 Pvc16 family protein [Leptolyngbya sp. 7M]